MPQVSPPAPKAQPKDASKKHASFGPDGSLQPRGRRPRIPSQIPTMSNSVTRSFSPLPGLPDRVEERAYTPALSGLSNSFVTFFFQPRHRPKPGLKRGATRSLAGARLTPSQPRPGVPGASLPTCRRWAAAAVLSSPRDQPEPEPRPAAAARIRDPAIDARPLVPGDWRPAIAVRSLTPGH